MNKRDLFVYLRGLLTFVIFASAITWFHFHADQLLSPRVSYIVHLSLSIGITILLTISFLTLCWYLLVTVFNKGRKLTMKARLLVASLCLVGILLLQDAFGIPLGLPERISRIINTIFGNGVCPPSDFLHLSRHVLDKYHKATTSSADREGAADDLAIHQRYHLSAALLLLGTEGEELSQGIGAH